jgi:hypothetical protein
MRFEEEYNHKIAQLLYNFPPDALLANGGYAFDSDSV